MADIVIALENEGQWDAFREGVYRRARRFQLRVQGAVWRRDGQVWPDTAAGAAVWVCWGTVVRGHAPLVAWELLPDAGGTVARVTLDLSGFVAENYLERYRDDFRRSWRYFQHRGERPLTPFPAWDTAGAHLRRAQEWAIAHNKHVEYRERLQREAAAGA